MLMEEQIEATDIEDQLDEWMEENFSVLADEESHREIGEILIKVRRELTFCATNDLDVPSGSMSLIMLREFNRRNQGNVSMLNEATRTHKEQFIQNDGWETCSENGSESDDSDDDSDDSDKEK